MDMPLMRLPTYHTTLIGRSSDVAVLSSMLLTPATRMLTLVGASGSGKTRLALEVAGSLAAAFGDGVVFVALAPVQDPRFVITTIARELEVGEQANTPLLTTLAQALAGRHMLLLLDNIEQVQAAAPDLTVLLEAAPQLTMLITSQVALDLPQEIVYPLPPLAVPADAIVRDLAAVMDSPAIALFVERMQQVQPRFQLSRANASAVVQICQLLDGYPLAIELVAAHSATLDPRDLLLLLRNHLAIHQHQAGATTSSRAAILNPVLDWCTSRLSAVGQQLTLRLGVFLGGWTTTAAQAVLAPEHDLETVAEGLALLAQKHLVLIETLPGHEARYVVLDAIREYSLTRLARQARAVSVHQRHAAYFESLARQAEAGLRGPTQGDWIKHLNAELHNLRTAIQWRIDQQQAEEALALVSSLYLFWSMQTAYAEARLWLTTLLPLAPAAPPLEQAKALKVLGVMLFRQGDYPAALDAYAASFERYMAMADHAGQAAVLNNQAIVFREQGRTTAARAVYEQALALYQQLPDPDRWAIANTLNNLGSLAVDLGDYAAAQRYLDESLSIRRVSGDQQGIVTTLLNLGELAACRGEYAEAEALVQETVQLAQAIGDERSLSICFETLAEIAINRGDLRQAHTLLLAAVQRHQDAAMQRSEGISARLLGYCCLLEQDWDAASKWLEQARHSLEAVGAGKELAAVYLALSSLALARQDPSAVSWLERATHQALRAESQPDLVNCAEHAAILLFKQDQVEPATRFWQAATAQRATMHRPPSLNRLYGEQRVALDLASAALPASAPAVIGQLLATLFPRAAMPPRL